MKRIAAVAVFASLAWGCGGSGDGAETAGDKGNEMNAAKPAQTSSASSIAKADYVLDSQDVSATLNVRSTATSSVTYTLTVFQKKEPNGFASLHDRTAKKGSGATFDDAITTGCQVSLQSGGSDTIKVNVAGPCSEHGLAAFSLGSGTYKKGDTHGCSAGTTFDSGSARCAGSGGQNDPADNHGCAPGTTHDPESERCAGSGGQNDPLDDDHGCAPGTRFDPASARCAGAGGQNDPSK
jgi:hypothetical protein